MFPKIFQKLSYDAVRSASRQPFWQNIVRQSTANITEHEKQMQSALNTQEFMDIKDKVAIITGGTSGIGLSTAAEFLKCGAKGVIISGSVGLKGYMAARQLCLHYGRNKATFVRSDVNDEIEFNDVFQKAINNFSGVDILVNSAAVLNERNWEQGMAINVNGTIRGTMLALKYMGKNANGKGGGVIINVAGTMGLEPLAPIPTYSASKHAIVGFSRSIGAPYHYNKTGLRVITVCPGFTKTKNIAVPMQLDPLARKELEDTMAASSNQGPEAVAPAIVHAIKYGHSGSVWVIEGSTLYYVRFPKRVRLKEHLHPSRNVISTGEPKTS